MSKILLGITGSVAAKLTNKMVKKLTASGHEVQIVATKAALYFWNKETSAVPVWLDEHEWPPGIYQDDDPVKHIELRDWADILIIAPLTANTLAKTANGFCDNLITSVVRAWCPTKPIVVAPAMNTAMWIHRLTQVHLQMLTDNHYQQVAVVEPVSKMLACGTEGVGAMAHIDDIVQTANDILTS